MMQQAHMQKDILAQHFPDLHRVSINNILWSASFSRLT